ncbi:chromate resistance protein ChrB domain-containing protein [Caldimonas sp.]|uniref:chromate resistance protein ChrB domain-containing protein n=1 Tax=Caldimonas sp. TaxID=2838790 RepID=UPI00391BAB20
MQVSRNIGPNIRANPHPVPTSRPQWTQTRPAGLGAHAPILPTGRPLAKAESLFPGLRSIFQPCGPRGDRLACAWLIRRFIDPQAECLCLDAPAGARCMPTTTAWPPPRPRCSMPFTPLPQAPDERILRP